MIAYMLQLKIIVMLLVTMIIMISGVLLGGPGPGPSLPRIWLGRKSGSSQKETQPIVE